ncbi:MAG TPA: hypothetical protein VNI02_13420 [Blastocatellia bacterium]|jgi:hypothetical protein|nr:hypothetical protein [Blastocatellia bacterium]
MKRNTILTLIIGLVISIGAINLWRAGATTTINRGYDVFVTPDNAVTHEDVSFGAGFFQNSAGSPSNTFNGTITFKGGQAVSGFNGDTVIERTQNVDVPGDTPLSLFGLRLVSAAPIHVTFSDNTSADYNVSVKESSIAPSTGTMHFNSDNTYSNSLQINREYTFTSPGQPTKVFDSYSGGVPAISLSSTGTWSSSTSSQTSANAAVPASGSVTIRPNTHQAIIAQHAITIAPRPSPTIQPIDRNPVDTNTRDSSRK